MKYASISINKDSLSRLVNQICLCTNHSPHPPPPNTHPLKIYPLNPFHTPTHFSAAFFSQCCSPKPDDVDPPRLSSWYRGRQLLLTAALSSGVFGSVAAVISHCLLPSSRKASLWSRPPFPSRLRLFPSVNNARFWVPLALSSLRVHGSAITARWISRLGRQAEGVLFSLCFLELRWVQWCSGELVGAARTDTGDQSFKIHRSAKLDLCSQHKRLVTQPTCL